MTQRAWSRLARVLLLACIYWLTARLSAAFTGAFPAARFASTCVAWWMGKVAGELVVAIALPSAAGRDGARARPRGLASGTKAALLLGALALVAGSVLGVWSTPFGRLHPIYLDAFVCAASLTGMLVAAFEERRAGRAEPRAPSADEPPALDATKLAALRELEQLDGDPFVDDLIDEFLVGADKHCTDAREAVAQGNAASAQIHMHSIKGNAAMLGATRLSTAAAGAERHFATRGLDGAASHLGRVDEELERVRPLLVKEKSTSGDAGR